MPLYTERDMLRTSFLLQKLKKLSNSVNTVDRDMILAFCSSSDVPLSMYQVSYNSLVYLKRYAPDKLFIAKIRKASNSVNTVDTVTILTFCISADGPPSIYQVSFNNLVYFQRYAPDKLFIAKFKKGSNSVNTGDRAMVLAFCTSADGPLLMYLISFNSLIYFQRYAPNKLFIAKIKKGSN